MKKYTSEILTDESEQADFNAFMQRVTFIPSPTGTKVQALVDGEPFTSFNDGDYWDAAGFHEGANTVYTVNFESEAVALNFFAAYLIGLASTQEAESWQPIHVAPEENGVREAQERESRAVKKHGLNAYQPEPFSLLKTA